jgi:hypothetical protein
MLLKKAALVAVLGLTAAFGTVASASAETNWQYGHPGRVEVNHRLMNQDWRIRQERREGEISGRQAYFLHREDRFIRGQERFDSRFNHGHLTPAEYHALNREENGVSRQIGR